MTPPNPPSEWSIVFVSLSLPLSLFFLQALSCSAHPLHLHWSHSIDWRQSCWTDDWRPSFYLSCGRGAPIELTCVLFSSKSATDWSWLLIFTTIIQLRGCRISINQKSWLIVASIDQTNYLGFSPPQIKRFKFCRYVLWVNIFGFGTK